MENNKHKHIWHLKDAKIEYHVTWKILKQAVPFKSQIAVICAYGKIFYHLQTRPGKLEHLLPQNELVTSCRQARKLNS